MASPEARLKLTGSQRAAVLLMSLGEEDASAVLKHMVARDVQKLSIAMNSLPRVSREQAGEILDGFTRAVEDHVALGSGDEDYVRKVLVRALGEDKARGIMDRIFIGRNSTGLDALKWMDTRAVAQMISQEHPQITAIVLAHLEPGQAAEVVAFLPDRMRSDVLMRIASLDGIQPSALNELDDIMAKQFAGNNTKFKSSAVGGTKAAADILNAMETAKETEVMEAIRRVDDILGQRIQDLMFVFDDLVSLSDRDVQALLRDVPSDLLVVALKGADVPVRDKMLANMSKRAAEMLTEDLEVKGPVKLSEVDAAQKEILATASRLAEQGTITLGAGNEEYV